MVRTLVAVSIALCALLISASAAAAARAGPDAPHMPSHRLRPRSWMGTSMTGWCCHRSSWPLPTNGGRRPCSTRSMAGLRTFPPRSDSSGIARPSILRSKREGMSPSSPCAPCPRFIVATASSSRSALSPRSQTNSSLLRRRAPHSSGEPSRPVCGSARARPRSRPSWLATKQTDGESSTSWRSRGVNSPPSARFPGRSSTSPSRRATTTVQA